MAYVIFIDKIKLLLIKVMSNFQVILQINNLIIKVYMNGALFFWKSKLI